MRRGLVALLALCALAAGGAWIVSAPGAVPGGTLERLKGPGDAAAGKRVFYAAGCESCHQSAGVDDPAQLGGGRPLATPFGTFYPPNISPDKNDGIGAWSVEDFAGALLEGRTPAGQPYYPAFPYTSYTNLMPEDVRDLYAYLKTLPAVAGRPPPHALSFPFNIRRSVGLWQALFFARGPAADPHAPPQQAMERGRYLVTGPGHCGECHTPRNALGALDASRALMGAPAPDGKGKVPAITAHALKDWSEADIADALAGGFTPSGDVLGGSMTAVTRNLAQLPAADRMAIAHDLKTLGTP